MLSKVNPLIFWNYITKFHLGLEPVSGDAATVQEWKSCRLGGNAWLELCGCLLIAYFNGVAKTQLEHQYFKMSSEDHITSFFLVLWGLNELTCQDLYLVHQFIPWYCYDVGTVRTRAGLLALSPLPSLLLLPGSQSPSFCWTFGFFPY